MRCPTAGGSTYRAAWNGPMAGGWTSNPAPPARAGRASERRDRPCHGLHFGVRQSVVDRDGEHVV